MLKEKNFRQFFIRSTVFVSFLYLALPFFFSKIEAMFSLSRKAGFNYTYTSLFTASILLITALIMKDRIVRFDFGKIQNSQIMFLIISFCFFYINFLVTHLIPPVGNLTYWIIFLGYISYLIASFFLFISLFSMEFFMRFWRFVVIAFSISLVFFSVTTILRTNWLFFSSLITQSVFSILGFFYENVNYTLAGDPSLSLNNFSVIIGSACSGVASLSMFLGIFILVGLIDFDRFHIRKLFIFFFAGIVGMFLMSIFRIYLLMIVGNVNPQLSLNLFHNNAGWMLFVIYEMIFLKLKYTYAVKERNTKKG